jgi:hypothetical protein
MTRVEMTRVYSSLRGEAKIPAGCERADASELLGFSQS